MALIRDLDFFMDIKVLIKAQQMIYDLDLDSNAKSLAMLLSVKANQFVKEEFYLTDKEIMKFLGIKDKHRLINARKVLIEKGFIEYEKGNNIKKTKTKYKVNWDKIINNK